MKGVLGLLELEDIDKILDVFFILDVFKDFEEVFFLEDNFKKFFKSKIVDKVSYWFSYISR